jgi:ATP-dependent Lon protease
LPLRDIVVFPHMIVPLFVGRERSVKALDSVMSGDKQILLLTQKTPTEDDPGHDGVYRMGTIGTILQLLKLPDGTVKVLVEGVRRAQVRTFTDRTEYLEAYADIMPSEASDSDEVKALSKTAVEQFEE